MKELTILVVEDSKPMMEIMVMTGFSEHMRISSARDMGVTEILVKPFNAHDLARRIMHVIDVPRDFVESFEFFGPDRRRKPIDDFDGDNRRNLDEEKIE